MKSRRQAHSTWAKAFLILWCIRLLQNNSSHERPSNADWTLSVNEHCAVNESNILKFPYAFGDHYCLIADIPPSSYLKWLYFNKRTFNILSLFTSDKLITENRTPSITEISPYGTALFIHKNYVTTGEILCPKRLLPQKIGQVLTKGKGGHVPNVIDT